MELSIRLQAVADLLSEGNKVADIGCDHGYIPIYLINQQKSPCVIAMDINEGPLQKAREHIEEQAMGNYIETRLSDGLKSLSPGEVDSIVVAGMGGGLVMKILSDSREVTGALKECVLQPQSEVAKVRAFLLQEGFLIISENMVLDAGKYYPMMKVIPPSDFASRNHLQQKIKWNEVELAYGKLLLENRNYILKEYLEKEASIKEQVLMKLESQTGEHIETRKEEISKELELIHLAEAYYEPSGY